MKERFIKILQATRKFGFVMAAVMMFPYVSNLPTVMASDGSTEVEAHEVSIEDLEQEYAIVESNLDYEKEIINQLEQYLSVNSEGLFILSVPENAIITISIDELSTIENHLAMINEMVINGEATILDDNTVIMTNHDEDFVAMGNIEDYFSVRVSWTNIYFNFPHKYSTIFIGVAITLANLANYQSYFSGSGTASQQLADILTGAVFTFVSLTARSIDLIEGIVHWGSYALGLIFAGLELAFGIASGGSSAVLSMVMKYVITLYTPSLFVAGKAFYYAGYGDGIQLKYRPWGYDSYSRIY